jgi:purine nucleoside permease
VLPSYPESRAFSKQFRGFAGALSEPGVMLGETLSASTYWHGERLSQWANDWVQVYSTPKMNFMTSNMEDSGTLTALYRLARIGRVDTERVMVLRTVSNYT